MNVLKYVIDKKNIPIIFSKKITHSDIMLDAISAGFLIVKFDINSRKFIVKCFGESTSLNIKIANEDQYLLENYLNNEFMLLLNE